MSIETRRWVLIAGVVLLAGALRFPRLASRPMHADEAILADKVGTLLEKGAYRYDPSGYHGPALPYAALIPAWLADAPSHRDLDEVTLRMTSVAAGMVLVILPFALAGGIGRFAAVSAMALVAVSPALVFYSRYFIPETLLVAFSFCIIVFGYRYARKPSRIAALLAGVSAGLTYASKETWVVLFTALAAALCLTVPLARLRASVRAGDVLVALGGFAIAGTLLYSSFLSNPAGVLDSLRSIADTYAPKALYDQLHVHPWHFYWQRLLLFRLADGPLWSEAAMVALAALGGAAALFAPDPNGPGARLRRFLAWYAIFLAAFYCIIPYKTPWTFLGPIHAMALSAGIGLAALRNWLPSRLTKLPLGLALSACLGHLGWQAYALNHQYSSDPRNPWVYAHTTADVYHIRDALEAAAQRRPSGHDVPVQVVSSHNLWPLPWYLSSFRNIEWWTGVSAEMAPAPLILATPEMEEALLNQIYEYPPPGQKELYLPLFENPLELRPGLEVRGYIARSLSANPPRKPAAP